MMMVENSVGLTGLVALHRFVHSVEADRALLSGLLDFEEVAASGPALEAQTGQRSLVFRAGDCVIVSTEPLDERSQADRYLRRHPEGIGALTLSVEDVAHALPTLERAGGTPVEGLRWWQEGRSEVGTFSLAAPIDDVLFHFVGPCPSAAPLPGFLWYRGPRGGRNRFGFRRLDHVTSNFLTMAPAVLWFKHVLGLTPYWGIQFHTSDAIGDGGGSGLRSVVLWDERSGIKLAANEPLRPNFEGSQISLYCDDQRGSGVQHVALVVDDIVTAVTALRARGARFTSTPASYYDRLPERLASAGIHRLEEDLRVLRDREILVDGNDPRHYLLQIFLEDGARAQARPPQGPLLLRADPAPGRRGLRRGELPRPLREHRRRPAGSRLVSPRVTLADVRALVRLGRPKFLPYSAVLYALGATVAVHRGIPIAIGPYLHGQLFIWCTHLMTHYCNEYFDLEADRENRAPTPMTGGSRVLVEGLLPPAVALQAALVLLFLSVGLLSGMPSAGARAIGCGMLALAWFYTAPPLRLNYRGLGEVSVSLVLNVATPLLAYQLQAGPMDARLAFVLLPGAVVQVVRMMIMNLMDHDGDLAAGKRTLVTVVGRARVKHVYLLGHAAAYGLSLVFLGRGLPVAAVILLALTAPLSAWQAWRLGRGLDRDVGAAGSIAFWASTHVALVVVATSLGLVLDRALAGAARRDGSLLVCAAIPLLYLALIFPQRRPNLRMLAAAR